MLTFTAIDFETANSHRDSVCAVGLAAVRNGHIVESHAWLVQPPGVRTFTNSRIHGITSDDVVGAPTWRASLGVIAEFAGETPLVAYNSPFDKSVYSAATRTAAVMDAREYEWRDACALAKHHLDLPRHRLPDVSQHLELPRFAHHDAAADAIACAQVTLALAQRTQATDIAQLWAPVSSTRRTKKMREPSALPVSNKAADARHPLFGASITFTGDLEVMDRAAARDAAARLGATVTAGPTRKSDLVVVGGFDPATLRPGASHSKKLQRAMELAAAGQRIEIILEPDFIALLDFDPSAQR